MTLENAGQAAGQAAHELLSAITSLLPGARPSMVGADLRGADLRGANLRSEDLTTADLTGADLSGANLQSAILRDADLPGARLVGADLTGANLHGADLCGADLTDVEGLASVDFEYAFADVTTRWPERFDPEGRVVIMRPVEDLTDAGPDSLPRRLSAKLREDARELFEKMRTITDR